MNVSNEVIEKYIQNKFFTNDLNPQLFNVFLDSGNGIIEKPFTKFKKTDILCFFVNIDLDVFDRIFGDKLAYQIETEINARRKQLLDWFKKVNLYPGVDLEKTFKEA